MAIAVNQVLDQRYQLQKSITILKDTSGAWEVESYGIQGLVIAGRAPEERAQLKSLELFRNGLKSVTVLTFDELLTKLEHILEVLREAPPEALDANERDGTDAVLDADRRPASLGSAEP